MSKKRSFDYVSKMKEHYKSDKIADEYHKAFTDSGSWRHQVIANCERKAVETLLHRVPHDTVLDIPTGTGKLAPVFKGMGSSVVACDISKNMLDIAGYEYERVGHSDVYFQVCDAEDIKPHIGKSFDVAVCLRLLHRVPKETKREILNELGEVADFVIASTAVESVFHKVRRWIRRRLFGGDERGRCYETRDLTKDIFTDGFEIITSKRVLPFISQEHVYLLKPTDE